jgi:hypothetical protein
VRGDADLDARAPTVIGWAVEMGAVAASGGTRTTSAADVGAEDFRAALERAFELAESDEVIGPAICATNLRLKFEFTDGHALHVWAGADGHLRWSFDPVEWTPELVLAMSISTANRYLQGRESLAIAIARGQVKVRGGSRAALRYLPAARMLSEPYRQVVAAQFPMLAA